MHTENNPYKARETLTFSITKESFVAICKIAEKNALLTFLKWAIPLTIISAIFLLTPFKLVGIGLLIFTIIFTIIYFCVFFIISSKNKKKIERIEDNLYNYTLYPHQLVITLKNEKYTFKEHVIPRQKANAKMIDAFLSFYHKRQTFAIPMRTLERTSPFFALNKKRAKDDPKE